MKSRILRDSIGSIIFLMLIFIALICIRPAADRLHASMVHIRDALLQRLEQETGLGIAYERLSPSVLSFLHIYDISLYDAQSGDVLLTVQDAALFFNLFKLFSADKSELFTRLVISGVELEYHAGSDRRVLERLLSFAARMSDDASDDAARVSNDAAHMSDNAEAVADAAESAETTDTVPFVRLPFDVEVRNISVHYTDRLVDVRIFLRSVGAEAGAGNSLAANAAGRFSGTLQPDIASSFSAVLMDDIGAFEGAFSLEGLVFPGLDGSTATLSISRLAFPACSVSDLDLHLDYEQDHVRVSTIQKILPFYLFAEYDTAEQAVSVTVNAERFDVFDLVTMHKRYPLLQSIQGSLISGRYGISFAAKDRALAYEADGSIWVSENLYPGGGTVSYVLSGSAEELSVQELSIQADTVDVSASLDVVFDSLQLSGYANVAEYVLPSGGRLSGEIYIDPLDRGFFCFIPEFAMNERLFTAVQLSVIPSGETVDFSFEFSDYSHIGYGEPGYVLADGSVWLTADRPYMQISVSMENFFLDSGILAAGVFADEEKQPALAAAAAAAAPYIMTNDIFIATDFSSVTYNIPSIVVANTEKDSEFVLVAADGNETMLHISQFDMRYAGQTVQLTAEADISPDYRDVFFSADCMVNTIPYVLTGNVIDGTMATVSGSYGFEAGADLSGGMEQLTAYLRMYNLPVSVGGYVVSVSADVSAARMPDDFFVELRSLELAESSGLVSFAPYVFMSGTANRYGFSFSRLSYSDAVSELEGAGSISWAFSDAVVESLSVNLSLQSALSRESYVLTANVSNPLENEFSQAAALDDWYFSSELQISEFPMGRLLSGQSETDTLSGRITAMGTLAMPYVSVQVDRGTIGTRTNPVSFSFSGALEDGFINVYQGELSAGSHVLDSWSAHFSLADFSGMFSANYAMDGLYTLDVPFSIQVESDGVSEDSAHSLIPDVFAATFATGAITGTLTGDIAPVTLTLLRTPGRIDLVSDSNTGISGYALDTGDVSLTLGSVLPVRFVMTGSVRQSALDLHFADMFADMSYFTNLLSYPFITVHGGIVSGTLDITGYVSDPEFAGELTLQQADLSCPDYVPSHITSPLALAVIEENILRIDNELFDIGGTGSAVLDLQLVFDRWLFDHVALAIHTPPESNIPVDVQVPGVRVLGEGGGDIYINASLSEVNISGSLYAQDTTVSLFTSDFQNDFFQGDFIKAFSGSDEDETPDTRSRRRIPVHTALELQTLNKVEIRFDPLLRGLVAPYTTLMFESDTGSGSAELFGDVVLRGGEVIYVNRNFYLREGRIVFDETSSLTDPRITVRAETRERDEDGRQVRITLSAENQLLSEFSPTYTASPPKSEQEIMEILGQILSADIESGVDAVFAGLDYGVQVLGIRKLEEILRDLLNLDIFSMRTMILQNVSKQLMDNSDSARNELSIGNFLDNTTVYIGKYFGSSIYLDALLHLSYDEVKQRQGGSAGGIVFQPDFGFEMSAPFATIRFGIAPEIDSSDINLVEATSISLSWKLAL